MCEVINPPYYTKEVMTDRLRMMMLLETLGIHFQLGDDHIQTYIYLTFNKLVFDRAGNFLYNKHYK